MTDKVQPNWVQGSWRFRDDTQDLDTTGGYLEAEDTEPTVDTDTNYRIRIGWGDSAGQNANASIQARLQFKVGSGGTWTY